MMEVRLACSQGPVILQDHLRILSFLRKEMLKISLFNPPFFPIKSLLARFPQSPLKLRGSGL